MEKKNLFTNVTFIPVTPQKGLIGFLNLVYDDSVYLSSIGVKVKPEGTVYLLCPSRKYKDKNLQIFNPINKETYEAMVDAALPEIHKFLQSLKNEETK